MSVFYDPVKKKPQVWVYAAFVLVPVIVFALFFAYGSQKAKNKPPESAQKQRDIFKEL